MKVAEINQEIERARTRGPLKDIVIQPCPKLLMELRDEIRRGDPEPSRIARIAGSDVAMAAALLRIANSPLYARSRKASTVADAVAMLGIGHTVSILTKLLLRRSVSASSPLIEHFWESSARRAAAMAYIARQLFGIDPDIAQNCGLFCHVAIPVLLQGLKGYETTLPLAMAARDSTFIEIENKAHLTDHAVVGAIVAKTWHLPPEIALAIRLHHDFTVLTDESVPMLVRNLVAMLLVAEHLVATHEGVVEQKEWTAHGDACLEMLHVNRAEVAVRADSLHPQFEADTGF